MEEPIVPKYKLFGERELWPTPEPVHHETIAARSALYDWEISTHSHDTLLQILFLSAGEATMTLETEQVTLAPPCLVLMPAGCVHGFRFSHEVEGQIVSIPQTILGELLLLSPELLGPLEAPAHHPLAQMPDDLAVLHRSFREFAREYDGAAPGRLTAMLSLLTGVLVWLARASHLASRPASTSRLHQRLQRFRSLIDQHYLEWQPVTFYADRLGVSAAQLNNTCRRESGHSAQALIHERLLLEARRLLAYSDRDVTAIAYALGFEDAAYFSRFFTRGQGMAPSAFRRLHTPGAVK